MTLQDGDATPAHLAGVELVEDELPTRPRTRADCKDGPRPCPWVGCRMNTYLHVREQTGRIALSRPGEPSDASPADSCALDLTDRAGMTRAEVASVLGVTRVMVDTIERRALRKVAARAGKVLEDLAAGMGEELSK